MLRAMPDLDLGPDDYRKQDAGSRHWYEPDDPRAFWISAGMAVLVLTVAFFAMDETVDRRVLFGFVSIFAFWLGFFVRALTSRWR